MIFILTFNVNFIYLCNLIKIYFPMQNFEKTLSSSSSVSSWPVIFDKFFIPSLISMDNKSKGNWLRTI